MHAVTVNKGPAAFAARALLAQARQAGRWFLHEGAVMDGIPVFNLVRETLPGVRVDGFRGVINTTTNFVLSALGTGQSFSDAVAEMQARGIAEADPSLDIDGWDAAAKTAALSCSSTKTQETGEIWLNLLRLWRWHTHQSSARY